MNKILPNATDRIDRLSYRMKMLSRSSDLYLIKKCEQPRRDVERKHRQLRRKGGK